MGFCVVRGCKSRSDSNNRGTKFHVMPRNIEIRKKWIAAIGRSTIPKSGSVCSKHFLPEDYQMSRSGCSESLLKTAIPSLNMIPTIDIGDDNEEDFLCDETMDNDTGLNDYYSTMDYESETTFDEFTDTINKLELEKEKDLPALTCVDLFPDPPHLLSAEPGKAEEEGSLADEDDFPGFRSAELKSDQENQNDSTSESTKLSSDSQNEKNSPIESPSNKSTTEDPSKITSTIINNATAPHSPGAYFSSAESVASSGSISKKSKKRYCRTCDQYFRKTRELHEHLKKHVTLPEICVEKLSDEHEKVKEYLSSLSFKDTSSNGGLKLKLKLLSSQNFEVVPSPDEPKKQQEEDARIRVLKASDIKCKTEVNDSAAVDSYTEAMGPKLQDSFLTPENKYFECPTFDGLESFADDLNNTNEATDDLLKKLLENNKEQQPFSREGEWASPANEFISIDSLAPRCNVCNMNFSHPKYLFEHKQLTGHDYPSRAPENHPGPNSHPDFRHHPSGGYMHGGPPQPHPSQSMPPLYQLAQMRGNFHSYGPRMNVRQVMHHHPQPSPPPGYHSAQYMMNRTPPPLYRVNGSQVNYPPGHYVEKRHEMYGPGLGNSVGPGTQYHNGSNQQQHHPTHHPQHSQHQHPQHHPQSHPQQHPQSHPQQHPQQQSQQPNAEMMRQPIFLKSRLQKAIRGRTQGPSNESPTPPGILSEQTTVRPRFLGPTLQIPGQMQFQRAPGPVPPSIHSGEPPVKRIKMEQGPQFTSSSSSSPSGVVSPGINNSPGLPIIQSVHSGVNNFPPMADKPKSSLPNDSSKNGASKNPKDVANILATRGITVTHKGKSAMVSAPNKGTSPAIAAQEAVQKLQANNSVSIISKKKPIEINVSKVPASRPETTNPNRIPAKFLSCPVITCKEKFLTTEGVNRHAFRWHGIPMPNTAERNQKRLARCRECNHLCASPEILQEHMRRHHAPSPSVNEIGIPIVDLRNDEVKRKLAGLGIFNYVPLTAAGASTSSLAFPVVSVQGASNPSVCNLLGLGASSVLSLGPIKSIAVRKINNNEKKGILK